jgi:uncharacterized protein (TIGR03382 family)
MNRVNISALAALVLLVWAVPNASAQNRLANPGFEAPITFDGPPFVGSWEGFSGGPGASASNSTASPRSGTMNADLSIINSDNNFAGVFQDVIINPGDVVTFSGWNRTPSNPLDVGAEFRIEWRNSATNTEVGRTPNSNPAPTSAYTQFSLTATSPANADIARVVYAIQSFSPEPTNTGTVYLDDMSATPEPTTMTLGLVGLSLAGLRRRRA